MNTDERAGRLRELHELAPIEFAVIGEIRVKVLSKERATFGGADFHRGPERFRPCPSVFIRGKNPLNFKAPPTHVGGYGAKRDA